MIQVKDVALDAAGFVYALGQSSTAPNPETVLKLTPDGQQTTFSLQIEGAGSALTLDRTGYIYVTGSFLTFKATPGAFATSGQGYVAKFNLSGALVYATYLDFTGTSSGATLTEPREIAVDSQGRAWVAGLICACPGGGATCGAFPVLIRGTNACAYGTASAIRELDANGAHLLASRTFGGGIGVFKGITYPDGAMGVAIDAEDSAWIVGTAENNQVPTTPGALEAQKPPRVGPPGDGVGGDGYAVKLAPTGDLLYGTYIGTNFDGADHTIASVALDRQGRPYFALNVARGTAAIVMALSADGSTILLSRDLLSPVGTIAPSGTLLRSGSEGDVKHRQQRGWCVFICIYGIHNCDLALVSASNNIIERFSVIWYIRN